MPDKDNNITELFDQKGNLIGALITAELWTKIKPSLKEYLPNQEPPEKPEPMADWEMLRDFWDFPYPVDMDVKCDHCGNQTDNWQEDEPRKFKLTVANIGGLVSYKCCKCKSRISKRHFKDEITTETTPYQESKDANKEACY
jgi:hypothetical protein